MWFVSKWQTIWVHTQNKLQFEIDDYYIEKRNKNWVFGINFNKFHQVIECPIKFTFWLVHSIFFSSSLGNEREKHWNGDMHWLACDRIQCSKEPKLIRKRRRAQLNEYYFAFVECLEIN